MQEQPAGIAHQIPLPAGFASDPIAILLAHHGVAEAQFAVFEAACAACSPEYARMAGAPADAVRSLLTYLEGDLETHIRLEEELLFPPLRQPRPPGMGT